MPYSSIRITRGVQLAVRAVGGLSEHPCHRRVGVLQRVEGQAVLAVRVFEQPHELVGRAPVSPSGQALRDRCRQVRVVGSPLKTSLAGPQEQVEDQRHAMAAGHGPHLVQTVRVEGREGQFRRLLRVHVEGGLPVAVADRQFAASTLGRQRHRQRGDHAGDLLGVPVRRAKNPPGR